VSLLYAYCVGVFESQDRLGVRAQPDVHHHCGPGVAGLSPHTAEANDKQQALPMARLTLGHLEQSGIERPKDTAGAARKIPATYASGYDSEAAAAVEQLGCDPYMATGRQ
jgi:hypothetical protein